MINEKYIVRAKRIPHATDMRQGDFIEGYYAGTDNGIHFIKRGFEYIAVDPATLGRCTGLRDKHGKLIFEGDIVSVDFKGVFVNCIVGWLGETASFRIFYDDDICGDIMNGEEAASLYEIIGNIHDNPDLLKGD